MDFKFRINPMAQKVDYEIDASYEELLKLDMDQIKQMNEISKKIALTFETKDTTPITTKTDSTKSEKVEPEINVPESLMQKITEIDERKRFPILWFYSTKPIMSVKEFLMLCSRKGFSLKTSWLPNVGGNFATILVKGDKMFKDAGKDARENLWALTDLGKLKIRQEIQKLESQN